MLLDLVANDRNLSLIEVVIGSGNAAVKIGINMSFVAEDRDKTPRKIPTQILITAHAIKGRKRFIC